MMDPQTQMIMAALDTLRNESQRGFDGVNRRLDELNGRTRKAEQAIGVLDERTDNMTCADHATALAALQRDVADLRQSPGDGKTVNWRNGKVVAAGVGGGMAVLYTAISLLREALAAFMAAK